ncbi:hypothetical protein TELCIR_11742 [Teladorsagia circumcincta]|uniref:EGF-like domain-containing protein n=1 Tax=Teladorsagia circumcincta TaxID=45464 RepID=A0A2G9U8L6_TELCI|nr:hypothetical protein TELCIR_11742 [Teladorsagia circumcincta]
MYAKACSHDVAMVGFLIHAIAHYASAPAVMELPLEYANDGCEDAGVEIKTHPDKRRTGYRSGRLGTTLSEDYYDDGGEEGEEDEDRDFGGDNDDDEDERAEEEPLSTSTKLLYRIFKESCASHYKCCNNAAGDNDATDEAEENGNLTIVPKMAKYTETLGSHIIAFYDLLMINTYYNCTDSCKGASTRCHNGGFAHPRNCSKCICPSGYGGKFCDERPTGCGRELMAGRRWKMLEGNLNGSEVGLDGYRRCNYWIKVGSFQ